MEIRSNISISVLIIVALATGARASSHGRPVGDVQPTSERAAIAVPLDCDESDNQETGQGVIAGNKPDEATRDKGTATTPADTDATLIIRVISKSSKEPIEAINVHVRPLRTDDETNRTRDHWVRTDAQGRASVGVKSREQLFARFPSPRPDVESKSMTVRALASGERREIVVELLCGNDLTMHALVLDAANHFPIAGAKVSSIIPHSNDSQSSKNSPTHRAAEDAAAMKPYASAVTDDAGRFVATGLSANEPCVRIDAKGFAPAFAAMHAQHETPDSAEVLLLKRGATLHAHVVDDREAAQPNVEVIARVYTFQLTAESPKPEHQGTLRIKSSPDAIWRATTDAQGLCALSDLPADTKVTVELEIPGRVRGEKFEIGPLQPGENSIEWKVPVDCTMSGLLIDDAGTPIAHHPVWLFQIGHMRLGAPCRAWCRDDITASTTTDEAGHFTLSGLAAGAWCVGPAAHPATDKREAIDPIVPRGQLVRLECGASQHEIVVRATRGLFIRGHVLDERGKPPQTFSVCMRPNNMSELCFFASEQECSEGYAASTSPDGAFVIGPFAPGEHELTACPGKYVSRLLSPLTFFVARSGDDNVLVRLGRSATVSGRVIDHSAIAGVVAEVAIAPNPLGTCLTGLDGQFKLKNVPPGKHTLVARTHDGVGIARGVDVAPGADVQGVEIVVVSGGELWVNASRLKCGCMCTVMLDDAPFATVSVFGNVPQKVLMPAGECLVRWLPDDSDQWFERRATVPAGGAIDVFLSDE
jgi:hypothetical protein